MGGKTAGKRQLNKSVLFSVLACAIIVIAIIVTTISYVLMSANYVSSSADAALMNACMSNADSADSFFNNKLNLLFSHADHFAELDSYEGEDFIALIRECAEKCGLRSAQIMIKGGATYNSDGKKLDTTHRGFVQEGLEGKPSVYTAIECDFCHRQSDFYSVPVRRKDGEIIGVLTGETEVFNMSQIKLLDVADIINCSFILDPDGNVLFAPEDPYIALKAGDNLIDIVTDVRNSADLSYVLNRRTGGEKLTFTMNSVEYSAGLVSIDNTDWTMAVIVPSSELTNHFGSFVLLTVVLICIIVVLIIAAIIVLLARFLKVSSEVTAAISEQEQSIYVDSVTDHETMVGFEERFAKKMKNTGANYALLSVDIDKFTVINDSLGYDGGNRILRQMSDIIGRNIGKEDFFARSSGDLFYILYEYGKEEDIINLASRIMTGVDYEITNFKMYISIGIYLITDHHIKCRSACDRSDMARKSIKKQKKSKYAFFSNSMIEMVRLEKSIENVMEDALERREFMVYLQPKFDLADPNEVAGAEALVRWKHEGRIVPPGDFIPVFEKNGFVTKIDFFMFEEVCRLQKKWLNAGYEPRVISVNMSRLHLKNPTFVEDLAAMCEKYEIPTKYFEIEITESAAYENIDILYNVFSKIKAYGFHVSIDDFGTGYSSLNMLKDLPVDVLKIDRSFLTEKADENENASHIIGCVVSLASALNISTICEGIETKEQAHLLTKLGCDMAQGFFFARPMPVDEFEKLTFSGSSEKGE